MSMDSDDGEFTSLIVEIFIKKTYIKREEKVNEDK